MVLLGCAGLMIRVGYLLTPILVVLLGKLSPITLTGRRWGMWTIPFLMLMTPTAVALFNQAAFLGVMFRRATSIAGHHRLIVRVLASMCIVVVVMVPERPVVWTLRVEVPSLISLPLDSLLFTEIVIPFFYRPFHLSLIHI